MHLIPDICIHILSRLFECTGIAIALTLASVVVVVAALAAALALAKF